jgi:hypothetical protein
MLTRPPHGGSIEPAWQLFKEEGFRIEILPHIFRDRPCLEEELDPRKPSMTTCPSWFQHFR